MDYLDEIVKKKKKNERVFVIDRRERKRKRKTRDDGFESKCSFDTNVNEKKNCFYFLLLFYLFTFFFPPLPRERITFIARKSEMVDGGRN